MRPYQFIGTASGSIIQLVRTVRGRSISVPNYHITVFLYNFTAGDYGTYWYHGHLPTLYAKELLGPLMVEEPDDPY